MYKKIILLVIGFVAFSLSALAFSMDTNIFGAIDKGDLGKVRELVLQNKVDVNLVENERGESPLCIACSNLFGVECSQNLKNIIEFLLLHCTEKTVNKANKKGETPIHLACYGRDLVIIDMLLKNGAKDSVDALDKNLFSVLTIASRKSIGNSGIFVKKLLPLCKKETINKVSKFKTNPFYFARKYKNLEVVKLFLQNGVDIKNIISLEDWIEEDEEEFENFKVKEGPVLVKIQDDPGIMKYINLAIEFDEKKELKDKIEFIFSKKEDKEVFEFLIKLAFGRSLNELEENKFKSPFDTVFFKLYVDPENFDIENIFGVSVNCCLHEFIEKASQKNYFRIDKSMAKKSEKQVFMGNLDKQRSKRFVDCVVKFD